MVMVHSRSLNGRRWSRQPLYADLMEWGTAGLHGSEQVADINRNARPTSSALWARMKSIVSIQPATNARTVLGSPCVNAHQAHWSALDDTKLACLQKGYAIRQDLLGRHQRNHFALRDDDARRHRWSIRAGGRWGEAHEPANATAKWRRCVGARRCGGTRSLARCGDARAHGDRAAANQLDAVWLRRQQDHQGLEY